MRVLPVIPASGFDPFVTGGFTSFGDADSSFKGWNIGSGADYWMKDRVGLRMEVRDHVRPDTRGTVQCWAVRWGIVFR